MNNFMSRALELAYQNLGKVSPNPSVAAIIVKNNKIIAEGVTQPPGGNHAEIEAMIKCNPRDAILYTTLEPCCHTNKRTLPCTDAIISSGIKKVVIATKDKNPSVNGKSTEILRKAGIEVTNLEIAEAQRLYKFFFKWINEGTPYITLKLALTADNRMTWGDGKNKKITGEDADKFVHELRRINDAVLVGVNTIIKDDSQLTCRLVSGRNPTRIILDSKLRIPETSKVLNEEGTTIVVCTQNYDDKKYKAIKHKCKIITAKEKNGRVDLSEALFKLGSMSITSILVEGGILVANSFFPLADRVIIIHAPFNAGIGISPDFSEKDLKIIRKYELGEDIVSEYERHN